MIFILELLSELGSVKEKGVPELIIESFHVLPESSDIDKILFVIPTLSDYVQVIGCVVLVFQISPPIGEVRTTVGGVESTAFIVTVSDPDKP